MSKIGIFMADGCEEIEGLTVVDVVRRAKMEIVMLSITGKKEVTSSHGVTFLADALAEETGYEDLDGIDRKSTRLNSSHDRQSRMPSSA